MDLEQRIHSYYQQGLTRDQLFHQISSDMDWPAVTDDQLAAWFQNLEIKSKNSALVSNYSHYTLIMRIAEELGKLESVIARWKVSDISNHSLKFLNSRYALAFSGYNPDDTVFWLLDNFHGQKRKLHIEGQFPDNFNLGNVILSPIDSEFLLFCDRRASNSNQFYIHLLKFNLPEAKCTLLDSQVLDGRFENLIYDCKCRHRFYLWYNDEDSTDYLRKIEVEDSKLQVAPLSTELYYQFSCERIDDSSFQTFKLVPCQNNEGDESERESEDENEDCKEVFGEYKLVPGQETEFSEMFDKKVDNALEEIRFVLHVWSNTKCYILGRQFKKSHQLILIFDLETQEITPTECSFQSNEQAVQMYVDETEGTVTLCTKTQDNKEYLIRRFKLGEPDKLANLALFKMRREEMFHGDGRHYRTSKFPSTFRPLTICPPE